MAHTAQGASAPTVFNFRSTAVRTLVLDGEVWFVASDVAKALGYPEAKDMTRILDEDESGRHIVPVRSENGVEQNREVTIINESGLYHAVLKSRKPEARPFRKWVTREVLPAIRKTGHYSATAGTHGSVTLTADEAGNLASLFRLLTVFTPCLRDVEAALRIAQSPLAATVFDAWHEPSVYLFALRALKERCDTVRDDTLLSTHRPATTGTGGDLFAEVV